MTVAIYVVLCVVLSFVYYVRVNSISERKIGLILLAVYAVDTSFKTSLICFENYAELSKYFDDQTMAILIIAMVYVSWLAIEPLWVDIKRGSTKKLEAATDD
ncbi:hypothetical protein [Vibrio coralliilyticus]|uniref:Uncharacterized protein n=1 Tax=Vibrio coralliilyticus TaxID=190893 RepID=A0AAP6ZPA5_9VIBR|nr:hypothetical protein [Vibrio coralliilyticus]AXN33054.1 hypothetical protein DVV14_17450 [Vibrio coralliilyticus]KPH23826.1 hypothetical protein ADU60_20655 [Vibrio coralliilyticus]NOJ25700.1 hypothetical protein [Vibrio coralliilyticus]